MQVMRNHADKHKKDLSGENFWPVEETTIVDVVAKCSCFGEVVGVSKQGNVYMRCEEVRDGLFTYETKIIHKISSFVNSGVVATFDLWTNAVYICEGLGLV